MFLSSPDVLAAAGDAAALGGEDVFVAAGADVASHQLFAAAVVVGRVDVGDAGVEDGSQDAAGVVVADVAAAGGAADFHGAVAEAGYVKSCAAESGGGEVGWHWLVLRGGWTGAAR